MIEHDLPLDVLDERERKIIQRRFGLEGYPRMTLAAIGEELGVQRERVRQIQNVAIEKIRRAISNENNCAP